ncbi:hypothetical protein KAW80_03950 [Candidatus Babeliales bacterium]|nr:hypothetical protein [Candidatus Babeliales bacterium]
MKKVLKILAMTLVFSGLGYSCADSLCDKVSKAVVVSELSIHRDSSSKAVVTANVACWLAMMKTPENFEKLKEILKYEIPEDIKLKILNSLKDNYPHLFLDYYNLYDNGIVELLFEKAKEKNENLKEDDLLNALFVLFIYENRIKYFDFRHSPESKLKHLYDFFFISMDVSVDDVFIAIATLANDVREQRDIEVYENSFGPRTVRKINGAMVKGFQLLKEHKNIFGFPLCGVSCLAMYIQRERLMQLHTDTKMQYAKLPRLVLDYLQKGDR